MSLEKLLSILSDRSGVDLRLDPNGNCALEYGPGLELTISSTDAGSALLLHQPVQFMSPAVPESLFRKCMELNLYGTQTYGGALGLDSQSGWIVLAKRLAVDALDPQRLEEALMQFIAAAGHIMGELGEEARKEAVQTPVHDEAVYMSGAIRG
ncbi:CesT family type III secretion system chaperone [Pseudochelatococcus lubricantis]|uniref:CesT family type III secretion system chaperone n=1 Tax=Pseudochelatococcus lubricantis TaxID=1538102 RepID=UPI0035EF131A